MTDVTDKALDFIEGMDTTVSAPHPMDESTIKGMFKYLKEQGVPINPDDIVARCDRAGWNQDFTHKIIEWAERVNAGDHLLIKNPEYFSTYMREQLKERMN